MVASKLVWLEPYGWAEAFFVGLVAASLIALVLSATLAAWRFFRPLSLASVGVAAGPAIAMPSASDIRARDELAQTIEKVRDDLNKRSIKTLRIDREVEILLHVALDGVDLSLLHEAERFAPEAPYVDLSPSCRPEMLEQAKAARHFTERATKILRGTRWATDIERVLSNAQFVADRWVTDLSTDERPATVDILQFRLAAIDKYKCDDLLAFIRSRQVDVESEMRNYRNLIINAFQARHNEKNN